ncbi:hypothetical protein H6G04_30000 [Calothrix membranacea FACHB-236]|nr:hypothetical protein [Calothrix membranacea FACHB-236]
MNQLQLLNDCTLLSTTKTYQIEGILCRYLYSTGTIKAPQYHFEALPGQRRQAQITLNRQKVYTRCYEVPGLPPRKVQVNSNHVQLLLF